MEFLKIVGICVLAAIAYGIAHDQITARICVEYFTVFHPPILGGTQSPTLLAFGWGVIATWWVGVILGIPLALVARMGSRPRLSAVELAPMIGKLLVVMAACAVVAGVAGYFFGVMPEFLDKLLAPERHRQFLADWWAHNASYASGFVGGIVLWIAAYQKRLRVARHGKTVVFQIDHLGIAVKSLSSAKAIYKKLGLSVSPEETVEQEQVRLVMVPVGESRLELLEATSENSTIAKSIAKRGEGLHHVCMKVPDLPAAVERLKKDGVRLVSEEIKVGAGGHQYVFVHPSSTGGVLLELVQS